MIENTGGNDVIDNNFLQIMLFIVTTVLIYIFYNSYLDIDFIFKRYIPYINVKSLEGNPSYSVS